MNRKTTIIILPGMDGTGMLLDDFVAALGPEFNAVVVRYRPDEPLGYLELEKFVRASLPTDRPFILLGESFSGPIAISLASASPPGLIGLVLCCTFVSNPNPLTKFPLIHWLPVKKIPATLSSWFLFGRFTNHKFRSAFASAMSQVSAQTLQARVRAVLGVDVSTELGKLKLPILYLRGTEDRVVLRSAGETVQRLAPQSNVVDLKAPHCLLQTLPDEAADNVRRFALECGR